MGRDVFPCLRRILNQEGRHPRAEPRPLAALSLVVPENAQMYPVPQISGEKLEQKKEAERGQDSAYHEEELSEIHRFSDC